MKFKTIAMTGVMSLAGLGLIGAGAHAAFTSNVSSQQTITAGTLGIVLSAPNAVGDGSVGNPLILPACGPTNSTFDCGPITVTITNNGTVNPTSVAYTFAGAGGSTPADVALASETYLCMTSDGAVVENSLLSALSSLPQTPYTIPTANGGTDTYTVEYYAGPTQDTLCGTVPNLTNSLPSPSPAPNPAALSLNSDAEGGVITPTIAFTYID